MLDTRVDTVNIFHVAVIFSPSAIIWYSSYDAVLSIESTKHTNCNN